MTKALRSGIAQPGETQGQWHGGCTCRCVVTNSGERRYCIRSLADHTDWVRCVAPSGDGLWLASAGNDQVVRIWNGSAQWQCSSSLAGHEHVIESVAWAPGSTARGSASALPSVPAAETSSVGTEMTPPPAPPARSDLLLATGSRDKTVRVWQVVTSQQLASFSHDNWVRCVAWHASAKFIISASDDRTIRVYDLKAARCLRTIDEAHSHFVTTIALHATAPILISGGVDTTIKLWPCK